MAKRGGKRKGAGRKSKAEELELIEKLKPLEPLAFTALQAGLEGGEVAFLKLYFEYMYGKPKQQLDVTTKGEKIGSLPENIDEEMEKLKQIINESNK